MYIDIVNAVGDAFREVTSQDLTVKKTTQSINYAFKASYGTRMDLYVA